MRARPHEHREMRHLLSAVAVLVVLAIAPAAAHAVTITEFPIMPGAAPGAVVPHYVKAGPDGALWITNRGTLGGIPIVRTNGQPGFGLTEVQAPLDIAVGPSGTVYWTESPTTTGGPGGVARFGGGSLQRFSAPVQGINLDPYAIALGAGESVFTGVQVSSTDAGARGIRGACSNYGAFQLTCRFQETGTIVKTRYTSAVAVGTREMWVAAPDENVIRRYAVTPGGTVDDEPVEGLTVSLPARSGPSRMVLGPDGNLWITMMDANAIDRFNLSTAARTRFQLPPGNKAPHDITVGPDGALWFTEFQGSAIGRITMAGEITEFPLPTPASAPWGITTGPDGAIWATEMATGRIARLVLDRPGTFGAPGGTAGGTGAVTDRVAPTFTKALGVTRKSFRRGTKSGRGTSFTFSLSEPAKVAIEIQRKSTGRRVNGRCVRRTRKNRRRSSCDLWTTVGTVRADGRQGANAVGFNGRLNGRNLSGEYRASAVATDPAGNASGPSRVKITVRR